jgi:hypothetical protein
VHSDYAFTGDTGPAGFSPWFSFNGLQSRGEARHDRAALVSGKICPVADFFPRAPASETIAGFVVN